MSDKGYVEQEGLNIWLPKEKGAELIGEVTAIDKEGIYGVQYTIKLDNGEEITTPSHKYLQNRMGKAVVGTKVRILYEGQEPPKVKGQSPTEIYRVFFKKA